MPQANAQSQVTDLFNARAVSLHLLINALAAVSCHTPGMYWNGKDWFPREQPPWTGKYLNGCAPREEEGAPPWTCLPF